VSFIPRGWGSAETHSTCSHGLSLKIKTESDRLQHAIDHAASTGYPIRPEAGDDLSTIQKSLAKLGESSVHAGEGESDIPHGEPRVTPQGSSTPRSLNTSLESHQKIQDASSETELSLPDDSLLGDAEGEHLRKSCAEGDLRAVKLLLEENADIETKDTEYGQTPLSWAAWNGHKAVVELLLKKNADIEAKDKDGQTPLSWAARNGHKAVVELLLKKNADIEAKNKDGQTLLSWAARNGYEAVVELLLEKNADIEAKDKDRQTPLGWAARNGYEAVVKLLLEKNADIETKDKYSQTPLIQAARKGHEAVVKLLESHAKTEI